MEKKQEVKYYLALENKPGDFMTIDINIIACNPEKKEYFSLQTIDSFTKNYDYEEIMAMIKRVNIVPSSYYEAKLEIINDKKYRYPLLTKSDSLSLDEFFMDYITDKNAMNKFLNIYIKYAGLKDPNLMAIKNAIFTHNVNLLIDLLFVLPYESVRAIYIYIKNNIVIKEIKLQLDKAAS